MNLDYGNILKKAWHTIWKFKILWIFGILAGCSTGGNGGFQSNFNSGGSSGRSGQGHNFSPDSGGFNTNMPYEMNRFFYEIERWFSSQDPTQLILIILAVIFIVLALGLVLKLLFIFLGTVGKIGLINGAWQVEEGAEKLTFGALLKEGWKSFWPVILLKLLLWVFRLALALVTFIIVVITLCTALCVVIPFYIIFPFVYWILVELILVAMVGEGYSLTDAIARSWNLFKTNWLTTSLMGLILGVISFIYDLILAAGFLLTLIPAGIGIFLTVSYAYEETILTALIITGILILIYIPVAIFLNGVKEAYMGVNWTIVYRRLTGFTAEQPAIVDAGKTAEQPPLPAE